MANSIKKALDVMFSDILKSKSALKRVLNPSLEGAGSRVYPPKDPKKDEKYGVRIDKGEPVHNQPNILRLKLEANSNAANKSISDMARKKPHAVLATADINVTQEATEKNLNGLKDQFLKKLEMN